MAAAWLERVSNRPPPPSSSLPPSRGVAPSPNRYARLDPNGIPQRPGLSPRTSSLSAASLASSPDSFSVRKRPPYDVLSRGAPPVLSPADSSDPVDILKSILGSVSSPNENDPLDPSYVVERPPHLVDDITFGDLSLEEFVDAHDHQPTPVSSRDLPSDHDLDAEKAKFEELHRSVSTCDEILNSVESYLTGFQTELAAVSAEIEHLQSRSTSMNNRLQNRRAVEAILGPEVESLTLSPMVVHKITEGAVDETWIKALEELEKRSRAIDHKLKDGPEPLAAGVTRPFIEQVADKATERIRDYVVAQIKALRSPNINAQVIQQTSFLRYKEVFGFLAKRQPQLAEEIGQAYNHTMRWYYASHFARYRAALEKLNLYTSEQMDSFAGEASSRRTTARPAGAQDLFSLGRRMDILRATTGDTAMPSFAAEEDRRTHSVEVPFRAFNLALVDNASAEYAFLAEFFSKQPRATTDRQFTAIFGPTFELGLAWTRQVVEAGNDALGVLLCVRITQRLAFELQRRKVPAADAYINGTHMLLWPRFQLIIDSHCDSVRRATAALTGRPAGSALSLTTSSSASAAAQTTAPHPVTQRFAQFVQGVLALSSEAGDDEPVANSLTRLRGEFDAFLIKLSKGIAEVRKRERFLYNNYSLICTIIAETEGKLAVEMQEHFTGLRDALHVEG